MTDQALDFFEEPAVSPRKIMVLLESFLRYALKTYRERRDSFTQPGYEDGLTLSNFALIVATIATSPDYDEGIAPRKTLIGLCREALEGISRAPWEKLQPFAWVYVSCILAMLRDELDPGLYDDLRRKVANWADLLLDYDFPTGLYLDTKAEETCLSVGPLVGAQVLYPGDRRCARWQEKANRFFLNSYNREEDLWEETVLEGAPVRDRVSTANVFPDFTTENHLAFHPEYQVCFNNYAAPYILYKKFLGRVPETLVWNWAGLHGVMARLYLRDGKILHPAGSDYYPYSHGEHTHELAIVTDALKDPLGLWAIKKALGNVHRFQSAHGGRLVGPALNGDHLVYWEFHFASFVAFAYSLAPFEGIPAYDDEQALRHSAGPWVSPYVGMLVHKGRKLHSGFCFKTIKDMHPGSGFVVPQGAPLWTDYHCAAPQLAPVIRNVEGKEIRLDLQERFTASFADGACLLGAWADQEKRIRRTMAFMTHDEEALHIERVMRYGEQVHIFGTDMSLARPKGEGPEYGGWSIETLNYRVVNDELAFRPIRVLTEAGEWVVEDASLDWSSAGDWLLIDGRLGLVRLWGPGSWHFDYRRETKPLREGFFWKHDTWALNVTLRQETPPPRGYGLMGGHAVLFVPCSDASRLEAIVRERKAWIQENHGDFMYVSGLNGRQTTHLLRLGHVLAFS